MSVSHAPNVPASPNPLAPRTDAELREMHRQCTDLARKIEAELAARNSDTRVRNTCVECRDPSKQLLTFGGPDSTSPLCSGCAVIRQADVVALARATFTDYAAHFGLLPGGD